MRPLKLNLSAFGPYLRQEQIDFTLLEDRLMFLMCGDTGAGKSTLLDAMCFALYGETAGDERQAAQMRSDRAPRDQRTEVIFEFSLGAKHYRCTRSPQQSRPKKRGTGDIHQGEKASLVELLAGDEERPISTKTNEVTPHVQVLLGFTVKQFRQVVVLPQGQFREFLKSGSQDRETILRQLFRTGRYTDIENALKTKAANIQEDLKKHSIKINSVLETGGFDNPQQLDQQVIALTKTIETQSTHSETLRQKHAASRNQLKEARRIQALLDQLVLAKARLTAIEETSDEHEQRQNTLARAIKADSIAADLRHLNALEQQHKQDLVSVSTLAERCVQAQSEVEQQRKQLNDAKASAPQIDSALAKVHELEGLANRVRELTPLRQQLSASQADYAKYQELTNSLDTKVKQYQQKAVILDKSIAQAYKFAQSLASQQEQLHQLSVTLELHNQYANLLGTHKQSKIALQEILASKTHTEQQHHQALSELEHLREARDQGRATVLAALLVDNEPCPVCGSVSHPKPATSRIDIPDAGVIKQAQRALDAQLTTVTDQTRKVAELQGALAQRQSEIDSVKQRLGPLADRTTSQVSNEYNTLLQQVNHAKQSERQLAELSESKRQMTDQIAQSQLEHAKVAKLRDEKHSLYLTAEAQHQQLLSHLPESLRAPQALDKALNSARALHQSLVNRVENAQQQAHQAELNAASLRSEQAQQVLVAKASNDRLDSQRKRWRTVRKAAGFDNDDAFHEAALDSNELKSLQQTVDDYTRQVNEAHGALNSAQALCQGLEPCDVSQFESIEKQAQKAWEEATQRLTQTQSQLKQLSKMQSAIHAAKEGSEALYARFAVVGDLANVANGAEGNQQRLSLHRYVLGVILDEVLEAASRRLWSMSGHRYRLQRRRGVGDQRRAGGLELDVFDEFTGAARPAATLSGGEGFQAALALALGLAEVTENHAGGVRLETLFIDEGFGSLDPDALDAAVTTLVALNQGGRLIGIISHVPEMAERIGAQLRVKTSATTGSHTRWVLP